MKKKITHPDGSVVEYEGTPEELAELENRITGSPRANENSDKGKRRILNEQRVSELITEALRKHHAISHPIHYHWCNNPFCRTCNPNFGQVKEYWWSSDSVSKVYGNSSEFFISSEEPGDTKWLKD